MPNEQGYPDSFRSEDWGLVEVPHVDTYKGLIFGTWNPEPVPLRESLGDMAWYLDAMLDRDPEGTEVVGGVHKWVLDGNWKLAAEQFATDWYHVNMSHASALMVLSPDREGPKDEIVHRTGRQYVDPNGHGAGFPVHPKNRFDADTVHDWMDYDALRERLGDARVEGPMTTGHATVFPNFSYLPVNGSIRIWHPKGPDRDGGLGLDDRGQVHAGGGPRGAASLQPAHLRPQRHLRAGRRRELVGVPGHRAWLHHQRGRPELPDGHGFRARGRHPPRHHQRALQRRRRPVLLRAAGAR